MSKEFARVLGPGQIVTSPEHLATVSLKVVSRKRRLSVLLRVTAVSLIVRIYDLRQKVIAKLRVVEGTRKS